MNPLLWTLLLAIHLLGAVAWVGGMAFAHLALRPAAAELLAPPQRLPLLAGTLGRFFRLMMLAVPLILLSGALLLGRVGLHGAPPAWHAMAGLGTVMAAIFVFIVTVPYPRLRRQVAAGDWPAAGAAMAQIRRWVGVNLVLGVLTVLAAVAGR